MFQPHKAIASMYSRCYEIDEDTRTVSEQRLRKHVPAETNTHVTIDLLWNGVLSMWSVPRCYEQESLKQRVS
jgi:hypothetical protein